MSQLATKKSKTLLIYFPKNHSTAYRATVNRVLSEALNPPPLRKPSPAYPFNTRFHFANCTFSDFVPPAPCDRYAFTTRAAPRHP